MIPATELEGDQKFLAATLAARAEGLRARASGRVMIGIAGQPGSGKSTMATLVGDELGSDCAVVPMDGYHLRNAELLALGRRERKGAPDTFDVPGFVALLRSLRSDASEVTFPTFDRTIDEPVADAEAVPKSASIVIVEGNYLLTEDHGWSEVRTFFDEVWYIALDESERLQRLIRRHEEFGMSPEQAAAWASGPDEVNAKLIDGTRLAADVIATTL